MTNLEALQATVAGYPLAANTFLKALTDRSVTSSATYSGTSEAFELATADIYLILATASNITEGGFSVSNSEKKTFRDLANGIYAKYDDTAGQTPKVRNASFRW